MTNTNCPACLGKDPAPDVIDHVHQYVNILGNTVTAIVVDDLVFRSVAEAEIHIKTQLSCGTKEALNYLKALPKRYN